MMTTKQNKCGAALKRLVKAFPVECWLMYLDRHESPEWTQRLVFYDFVDTLDQKNPKLKLSKLKEAIDSYKLDPCLAALEPYISEPAAEELLFWCRNSDSSPWQFVLHTAVHDNILYTYETSVAMGAVEALMTKLGVMEEKHETS